MFRSGESETQVTDLAGQVAFAVGSGTWQVAISARGFQNLLSTLIVNGDQTPVFNLMPIAVSPPAGPDLCVVQAFVYQNGDPVSGAIVKARLRDANSTIPAAVLSTQCLEATTDSNGYAELQLVRQPSFTSGLGIYIIDIWHTSRRILSLETPIPNQSTATLDQLISLQS
ncbi:MAG: hypothetical protein KatS3mg105_5217 [Gemmatales bacterium]|nr:MAG: hypothetical protein KatS3mg105_5217 [Gemmatales bacterium]GIW99816.1 MAG: hypothetical protein KatS3mg111_3149 [Pirellulaceae bacterium]